MASWQYGFNPHTALSSYTENTFSGSGSGPWTVTVKFNPILPSVGGGATIGIYVSGTLCGQDNGSGTFAGAGAGTPQVTTGTVNYVTGAISVTFASTPGATPTFSSSTPYTASTINTTPATNDDPVFNMKATLVQAGWTVLRSSDGTTYNSSGDQIYLRGTGANSIGNASAWFVIRDPNTTQHHYYLFRRGASAGQFFIGVALTDISGGSPGATTTPTNALMWGIFGASGNVSTSNPTTADYADGQTTANFHHEFAADSSSPYGAYGFAFTKNPTDTDCWYAFLYDGLASGSYQSADPDPWYTWAGSAASNFGTSQVAAQGVTSINGVLGNNYIWLQWVTNFIGNPYTGKDDLLPVWYYGNASASQGKTYKGQSFYFKWETFAIASRGTGQILDQVTLNDTVLCNVFCFPWNGQPILLG